MARTKAKADVYVLELTPGILKALSHPIRLDILRELHGATGADDHPILSARDLSIKLGIALNHINYHLKVLASEESEYALVPTGSPTENGSRRSRYYRSTLVGTPLVDAYLDKYA